MTSADRIQDGIIDKLLTKLTEEQSLMLERSEEDIKHGRLIPRTQVDKDDLKWLREQ